jgi:hypothetical protein
MTDQKKSWNLAPIITIFVAAIPVTVGLTQYYITRQTEFRKRFWEEQVALYREATDAAAEIAMAADLKSAELARQRFWKLYWGKLSMIEHKEVERAMIAFGGALSECEKGNKTTCFGPIEGEPPTELRSRAYQLAHCARYSLAMTWNPAAIDDSHKVCPYAPGYIPPVAPQ